MRKKSIIVKRIILTVLTFFVIGFIFYNSSLDASQSTVHSGSVLMLIENFLSSLHIDTALSENFIRKCAHFVEYFILGALLVFTISAYSEKRCYRLFTAVFTGLSVACIDEVIQLYSYGRSGQVSDVLLDFSAVVTAVMTLYIFSCKKDKEVQN